MSDFVKIDPARLRHLERIERQVGKLYDLWLGDFHSEMDMKAWDKAGNDLMEYFHGFRKAEDEHVEPEWE